MKKDVQSINREIADAAYAAEDYSRLEAALKLEFSAYGKGHYIYLAASEGKEVMLKFLLDQLAGKIDIHIGRQLTDVLIHGTAPIECLKILAEVMTYAETERSNLTILRSDLNAIVQRGTPEFMEYFFDKFPPSQELLDQTLAYIAEYNFPDKIEFLTDAGADVNYATKWDSCGSILMRAISTMSCQDENRKLETVIKLLELGADPNYEMTSGKTTLQFAAVNEQKDIVFELLEYGAVDTDGKAEQAARGKGFTEIADIITEAKTKPKAIKKKEAEPDFWRKLQEDRLDKSVEVGNDGGIRFV